jgi:hypothetical protein
MTTNRSSRPQREGISNVMSYVQIRGSSAYLEIHDDAELTPFQYPFIGRSLPSA